MFFRVKPAGSYRYLQIVRSLRKGKTPFNRKRVPNSFVAVLLHEELDDGVKKSVKLQALRNQKTGRLAGLKLVAGVGFEPTTFRL
jgi:hypothetical protein